MKGKEWLTKLKDQTISTESDDAQMAELLHILNYPKAVVTKGVVYFTPGKVPMPIQTVAAMLLGAAKKQKEAKDIATLLQTPIRAKSTAELEAFKARHKDNPVFTKVVDKIFEERIDEIRKTLEAME